MTSDLVLLGLHAAAWLATVEPTVWLALATGAFGGVMIAGLLKGWV